MRAIVIERSYVTKNGSGKQPSWRSMAPKLCPKIILEGTRLTFKTEIAFALNEHPRKVGPRKYRYHSPLISAEWCAVTNEPWGCGLVNFEAHEEERAMETYRTWLRLFHLLPYYSWIVDRFHLYTKLYQSEVRHHDYDFRWLEEKLLSLGFRHVFCFRKPESFAGARAERLKVSGNPGQYDDLSIYLKEQERMEQLIDGSLLPHTTVDVSDNNVDAAVGRIADWLDATGGLYIS